MMKIRLRRTAAVAALALAWASCGGSAEEVTSATSTTTDSASTSSATTLVVVSVEPSPPSTTKVAAPEPLEIDRLEGGLPATFVAVTDDWAAVEVDTATGQIVEVIGQGETPDMAEGEGMVASAIDRVVRSSDGEWLAVSECCEPAAGYITFLAPGDDYPAERPAPHFAFAWSAAPSPFDGRFATAGFEIALVEAGGAVEVVIGQEPIAFTQASGVIAWGRNGRQIHWISNSFAPEGGASLLSAAIDGSQSEPAAVDLNWVASRQWLDGIGSQESGNLVGFLNTMDDAPEPQVIETQGVVFSASGELVATFPVETGSLWGGYDPAGRVLIYTDAAGMVRWQGLGQSGVLADGFVHASW